MNVQKTPVKDQYNETSTNFDLLEIQEPVRWMGPFLNYSGFASEMLNFLVPLLGRVNVGATHSNPAYYSKNYHRELPDEFRHEVDQLLSRYNELNGGIAIAHGPVDTVLGMPDDSEFRVLRTMFETDRIAPFWVEIIKVWMKFGCHLSLMSKRFTAAVSHWRNSRSCPGRSIQLCLIQTGPNL